MNILFYDSEYTGHHSEYVKHILANLTTSVYENISFIFVLNIEVVKDIRKDDISSNVQLLAIDSKFQLENPTGFNGLKRTKAELKCVNYYCAELKVDKCFLLNINPFLLVSTFPWFKFKCQNIQSIHFHPYYRMISKGVKDKLKFHLKGQILRNFAKSKNVKRIFILNDSFVCNKLNSLFKLVDKFAPLADPVNIKAISVSQSINKSKKRLLFWGYINSRKGIHNALDAICLMNTYERTQIEVEIAGKIDDEYKNSLQEKIKFTRNKCPEVDIVFKEGFVRDEDIPKMISDSDLIMAPYTKMEGSSGLLGWAAAFKKPILGPKEGLIGELIENYRLGITVDTSNIEAILDGLNNFVSEDFVVEVVGQDKYLELNSPINFAETILDSIVK